MYSNLAFALLYYPPLCLGICRTGNEIACVTLIWLTATQVNAEREMKREEQEPGSDILYVWSIRFTVMNMCYVFTVHQQDRNTCLCFMTLPRVLFVHHLGDTH